jgi:hypothetical protein
MAKRKRQGTPKWISLFTQWIIKNHNQVKAYTAEEAYAAYCNAEPNKELWPSFSAFKIHAKNCNVQFKQNLQLTRDIRPRKKDRTRTLAVIVGAFFEELEAFIQTKLGETVKFGEQRKSREILLQIIEAKGLFTQTKKPQQPETEFCETQEESFEDDN